MRGIGIITICMCICKEYATAYTRIIIFFHLSVACEPYFVDNFALNESNLLWVSFIFHYFLFFLDMGTFIP